MADEQVIIEIKVETDIRGIDDLNKNIESLKTKQEQLNADFISGSKTLAEYREQTKENSTQLKSQENALKSVTSAVKIQQDSINDLREQNKKLTQERNNLNLSNAEGQKRLKEINDQLDKNNKKIKENVSSLEQQKINIGNYASALDGVVPGLGGFVNGIDGATKASKQFIATPLGAILAAIALALGAVYKYLEKYEPILDLIENAVTQVTSAFDSFIQNIDQVGRILGNVLTLNFSKAADEAKNLGDKMAQAAKDGQDIVNLTREIEDATIAFELSSSRVELQIKRLVIAAKNRTLTAKEQQDLLNQAIELENNQIQENLRIKNLQFEADVKALIQSKKAQVDKNKAFTEAVQQNKTLGEQFEILAKSGIFSPEQLAKALASFKAIDQAEGESLAFLEKVQNQKDAIAEKDKADREKAAEEKKKKDQLDAQYTEEAIQARQDAEIQALSDKLAEETRIENDAQLKKAIQQLQIDEDTKKQLEENEKQWQAFKEQEREKEIERIKADNIQKINLENNLRLLRQRAVADTISFVGSLLKEGSKAQKIAALAEVAYNVGVGFSNGLVIAQQSAKATGPGAAFAFPAFYATQISAILAAASKARAIIQSGNSSTGGSSISTSVSGGRSGITATQATTNPINQSFSVANAVKNMPPIVASWKEATEVQNKVRFKESLTTV
jgi:hypothetical protein